MDPRQAKALKLWEVDDCTPNGIAFGPNGNFALGCSAANDIKMPAQIVIMNTRTGKVVANVAGIGGADEINYNKKNNQYYITARMKEGNRLGVIDAATNTLVQKIPVTGGNPHSVTSTRATAMSSCRSARSTAAAAASRSTAGALAGHAWRGSSPSRARSPRQASQLTAASTAIGSGSDHSTRSASRPATTSVRTGLAASPHTTAALAGSASPPSGRRWCCSASAEETPPISAARRCHRTIAQSERAKRKPQRPMRVPGDRRLRWHRDGCCRGSAARPSCCGRCRCRSPCWRR